MNNTTSDAIGHYSTFKTIPAPGIALSDQQRPSVLFVGHEATRTGAPIAMLHFMRWYRHNVGGPMSCILIRGGELEAEFSSICPTVIMINDNWHADTRIRRLLRRAGLDKVGKWLHLSSLMRSQLKAPQLIYCNTIDVLEALNVIDTRRRAVLCYVHELDFVLQAVIGLSAARQVIDRTKRFIACSNAVAKTLSTRFDTPEGRIEVVYESIALDESCFSSSVALQRRLWLRENLQPAAPNAVVVGGSGGLGWRKGSDLFVQLASIVRQLDSGLEVHFLWLGGDESSIEGHQFIHDVERKGLTAKVTLIPSQPDPIKYFQGMDLFVLTSREDPYPLVCLEAAACGLPVICFEGAGGMPEFVEDNCGVVVPYLDMNAMAAAVVDLIKNKERRLAYGSAGQQTVSALHDITVTGPKVFAAMQRCIES